ncbi:MULTISPECIES: cytochrome D1 domain-containing protein [Marinobacter]|jgi:protein NirF|uniref:Heme d1 biosynthesis protein NirF n=1 Tax=Marinobacter nauticus TaxID=2743 RepID=A0A833JS98_MARNT|nr:MULTISPECIES: cytochrome D1 domain-containing protein [Marinobacter]KAE8545621.1 Heme d1 biosynthesis protein NirF [Marinobacter nauticus]MEC8897578.1 cytochrome D1 domain-containing protein [Pseudomonadota bacterium]|tara:strand:+ start:835 stop:2037 length:1203 start_codon:yes stop_codon:yes gene_type:complete
MKRLLAPFVLTIATTVVTGCQSLVSSESAELRGTGDLGLIIERATGSVLVVDHSEHEILGRVEGLGDLSHASVVYSRDARYGYVFGRDGGLTKVDLLTRAVTDRVIQSGNSIGGAISQDGRYVAVSNYEPGGVNIFDSETLDTVAEIPAFYTNAQGEQEQSKTVGLVDAPGNQFVFSLFEAGEIWTVDMYSNPPGINRYQAGKEPYDALITPDGRFYIAGLFGEDGLSMMDLWEPEQGAQTILPDYGKGEQRLPVYKMPHLEGWAIADGYAFVPAVGRHEVLVADMEDWSMVQRIPVQGQPVFVMASPDNRQIWVSFAHPKNDVVQVIDSRTREIIRTLEPGKSVLHMEFTPRGEEVWVSSRDSDRVTVYNTRTLDEVATLPAQKPSGIFFTNRAHQLGL